MTEEQIEIKSKEYAEGRGHEHYNFLFEENAGSPVDFARLCYADGLKDGTKENAIQWHDLKKNPLDVPKGDIHRKILLQDRYGYIYTGNYYPKDDCHPEDGFAVEFLEWGFQGCNFVAFEQIAKWKEFEE